VLKWRKRGGAEEIGTLRFGWLAGGWGRLGNCPKRLHTGQRLKDLKLIDSRRRVNGDKSGCERDASDYVCVEAAALLHAMRDGAVPDRQTPAGVHPATTAGQLQKSPHPPSRRDHQHVQFPPLHPPLDVMLVRGPACRRATRSKVVWRNSGPPR
jgi:hypothetical protein